jgi:hypothetical protein
MYGVSYGYILFVFCITLNSTHNVVGKALFLAHGT